jgi:hypothetical protein
MAQPARSAGPRDAAERGSGGKRGWKQEAAGGGRARSAELFQAHRLDEHALDCALVEDFLRPGAATADHWWQLAALFGRTFLFGDPGVRPRHKAVFGTGPMGAAGACAEALAHSFGLAAVLARCGPTSVDPLSSFVAQQVALFDDAGQLRMGRVFGGPATTGARLPVKLEICSGGGEWAVTQAAADAGRAHWLTLELRHDRVHQTFLRAAFERVDNLCVLGGNAMEVLPRADPRGLRIVCGVYES